MTDPGAAGGPAVWRAVRATDTGLHGRAARLLTSEPTDDAGWPAADRDLGERLAAILSAAGCEQEAAHEQARAA